MKQSTSSSSPVSIALFFVYALILAAQQPLNAQLVPASTAKPEAFVEQVRRFEDFRQSHRLDTIKGWKYYKRWEHQQLMHTGGYGHLTNPDEYHLALLQAAEQKRVARSLFTNDKWLSIGPDQRPQPDDPTMQNGMGRVNCIAFHPTDSSTYYVGVAQGGLWKTTDDGAHWKPLTDQLPIIRISDIAIDPNNPNTIYIALGDYEYIQFGMLEYGRKRNTYFGIGIYKSTDGGNSWAATGLGRSLTQGEASLICKIIVHPTNGDIVIAAGTTGFYYSSDAGAKWLQRDSSLAWDLQLDPTNPNVVYATSGHLMRSGIGQASIMKSTDFGYSWTRLNTGIPPRDSVERIKIAISPSDPRVIYAACTDRFYGLHGVYRSTNAGSSWTKRFDSLNVLEWQEGKSAGGQGSYDLSLQVHATNSDEVYIGGINVWGTKDGGLSFYPATYWIGYFGESAHADHHLMSYRPLTGHYYLCNDGGVVRTKKVVLARWDSLRLGEPFKTVWTPVTKNMAISSFYRLSSSKQLDERVIAGAQDNSTAYFNGKEWRGVISGDGMDNWIDPQGDSIVIGSSQSGYFFRAKNGVDFEYLDINKSNEAAEWTTPLVADPTDKSVLYIVFSNVYRSSDKGSTWTKVSDFPVDPKYNRQQEASALAVSASNPDVLMVCRRLHIESNMPSLCMRSTDGGKQWTNVTSGLPDSLYFTSIEISDDNPNLAWLSCAGLEKGSKVYRTTDGGQSWVNISYDLPNLPVNVIKQVPNGQRHMVMIGTDVGIYVINDSTKHWISYSSSLPNVIISDLEFNESVQKMYCATFGRGVWECATIYDLPSEINEVNEVANRALELYPQPLSENTALHLRWTADCVGPVHIEISSEQGKLIQHVQKDKISELFEQHLPLTLPPGVYFLRCQCGSKQSIAKFVIH